MEERLLTETAGDQLDARPASIEQPELPDVMRQNVEYSNYQDDPDEDDVPAPESVRKEDATHEADPDQHPDTSAEAEAVATSRDDGKHVADARDNTHTDEVHTDKLEVDEGDGAEVPLSSDGTKPAGSAAIDAASAARAEGEADEQLAERHKDDAANNVAASAGKVATTEVVFISDGAADKNHDGPDADARDPKADSRDERAQAAVAEEEPVDRAQTNDSGEGSGGDGRAPVAEGGDEEDNDDERNSTQKNTLLAQAHKVLMERDNAQEVRVLLQWHQRNERVLDEVVQASLATGNEKTDQQVRAAWEYYKKDTIGMLERSLRPLDIVHGAQSIQVLVNMVQAVGSDSRIREAPPVLSEAVRGALRTVTTPLKSRPERALAPSMGLNDLEIRMERTRAARRVETLLHVRDDERRSKGRL